jgi:pectate lyase
LSLKLTVASFALAALAASALVSCATAPAPAIYPGRASVVASADLTSPRQTQSAGDGWSAHDRPVTGGADAADSQVYRVRTRAELVNALAAGGNRGASNTAKVIFVEGTIDLSVDSQNRPLTERDYQDAEFDWAAYAKQFDLQTWGKKPPEGPFEDARKRSADRQASVVVIPVGSNTSLIGVGSSALIKNGGLMIKNAENVLIRNITFEDAYDYFPAWDPKDNANGEWNSEYDNVTIYSSRRVWIDHCTFSDGARPDKINRTLLGRPMQFHDGLADIVRGSDLVTVSYSHFRNHDKGMLIGNSDNRADDGGKLRVTLHHNWFENVKERSPRVRYGRVHVYNNLYTATPGADYGYGYSIGVGFKSQLIVEGNVFDLNVAQPRVFKLWRGDRILARDNLLGSHLVDALAILQPQANSALGADAGWTPPYAGAIDPVLTVAATVKMHSGAGRPVRSP